MRRLASLSLLALLVAAPAVAMAADDNIAFDFLRPGPLQALYERIMNVAKGGLVLAFVLGLILEFVKAPGEDRNYAAVLRNLFIVALALSIYPQLAGTVVKITQGIAQKVAPSQIALFEYNAQVDAARAAALRDPRAQLTAPKGAPSGSYPTAANPSKTMPTNCPEGLIPTPGRTTAGDIAYFCAPPPRDDSDVGMIDSIIGGFSSIIFFVIFAFMGATRFVIEQLGAVLAGLFYLIGPLALAASVPRGSGAAANWFRHFLVYCSWPIFSGLLLNLVIHVAGAAIGGGSGYINALWSGLVFSFAMLSVPMLAGQLIGGGSSHIIAAGFGSSKGVAGDVKGTVMKAVAKKNPAVAAAGKAVGGVISNPPGGR